MLVHPRSVIFGGISWDDVESVVIDRVGARVVIEHDDNGPHPVFVDVVEQRVRIRVTRALTRDEIDEPVGGTRAELRFDTSIVGTDGGRRRVRVEAVITDVRHESERGGAVRQIVSMTGISSDGRVDPVRVGGV